MFNRLGDRKYVSFSFIFFGILFLILSLTLRIEAIEHFYHTYLYSALNHQQGQTLSSMLLLIGGLLLSIGVIETFVLRLIFKKVPKYSYDERYRKEIMKSEAVSHRYYFRGSIILLTLFVILDIDLLAIWLVFLYIMSGQILPGLSDIFKALSFIPFNGKK